LRTAYYVIQLTYKVFMHSTEIGQESATVSNTGLFCSEDYMISNKD